MLFPTNRVRVYLYRDPCDMRKSFSGLVGLVRKEQTGDPLSGHLFLFLNRRRDYVKILWWDTTGFCIWAKRLTRGTYRLPQAEHVELSDIYPLLEGFEPTEEKRRYRHIPQ